MRAPSRPAAPDRPRRLPGPARRAVRTLRNAYLFGTDADYAAALAQLGQVAAALDEPARALLNAELAAAHEELTQRAQLEALRSALAGPWESVQALPGDVELVRLTAGGPDMFAVVPAARPEDPAAVVALVEQARAALRAGRCPRCAAGLAESFEGQASMAHNRRCPLAEDRLRRTRSTR